MKKVKDAVEQEKTSGKDKEPKLKEEILEGEGKPAEEELDPKALKIELDEKNKLVEEYYDKLLRTQAEFENYKKRTEKEVNEFKNYANAQLIRDLLGIIDDFHNALESEKKGVDEKLMKGFELIYNNFYSLLEKEGLSMINPSNEKFDPWRHEAVEMVSTREHGDQTIICVVQPGFKFKDKILRPAKVRVAVEPKEDEEKDLDENEGND